MLAPPFLGFGPRAIAFFDGLKADNSKAYFDANRAVFEEQVKGPLGRLFEEAAERHGGTVKLFRQHRDIRFSKDKSPYKTNTYGVLAEVPGRLPLYASVSADGIYAGTGMYMMARDQVDRFRAAIDDAESGEAFAGLIAAAEAEGLSHWGATLKTAPRGVARDHPRIGLLRLKEIVIGAQLGPAATLDGRHPLDHCLRVWEAARPVSDWLMAHVGASVLPSESGRRR